jgi:hypothetical protein
MTIDRALLVAIFSFVLASCGDPSRQYETHEHASKKIQTPAKLRLNGGEKWNVDDPTNMYVNNMQGIVQRFDMRGSEDYNMLADSLRVQTTDLVVNCKMKGPDHDALHVWLGPVLDDVKALAGTDKTEAKKSYDDIKVRLTEYDTYFQ